MTNPYLCAPFSPTLPPPPPPQPLKLHKETGIGELSNLTFVLVDGNLTTRGVNEAIVNSVVVTIEDHAPPSCGLGAAIGIKIYSKGEVAWEKEKGNGLTIPLPIPGKGYSKTITPDRPIVVERGDSYILVDFVTTVAHLNDAGVCDFLPPVAESATGSLQLDVTK